MSNSNKFAIRTICSFPFYRRHVGISAINRIRLFLRRDTEMLSNGHGRHKYDTWLPIFQESGNHVDPRIRFLKDLCRFLSFALVGAVLTRMYLGLSAPSATPQISSEANDLLSDGFQKVPYDTPLDPHATEPRIVNAGMHLIKLQEGSDSIIYPPNMRIANSTLDCERIVAITMEKRPDRRDMLTLMAATNALNLTFVEGSLPGEIADKALPREHNPNLTPAAIACWRSHMNVWRMIVQKGWTTTMIIEDDADWDVNIRMSLPRIMEGMDTILNTTHAFAKAQK